MNSPLSSSSILVSQSSIVEDPHDISEEFLAVVDWK